LQHGVEVNYAQKFIRTSPRTQFTPITKINRLMLYRGNNRCLLWKSHKTGKYAVRLKRGISYI